MNGFVGDLNAKTSKNFATFSEKPGFTENALG